MIAHHLFIISGGSQLLMFCRGFQDQLTDLEGQQSACQDFEWVKPSPDPAGTHNFNFRGVKID